MFLRRAKCSNELILVCVDDILIVSNKGSSTIAVMKDIGDIFEISEAGSVGRYFGVAIDLQKTSCILG